MPKTVAQRIAQRVLLIGSTLLFLICGNAALAQAARLDGETLVLDELAVGSQFFRATLQLVPGSDPLAFTVLTASELGSASDPSPNRLTGSLLEIPTLSIAGVSYWVNLRLQEQPSLRLVLENFGLAGNDNNSCQQPAIDPSHGPDNPQIANAYSVSTEYLLDGGPAPDGIPSIDNPVFEIAPSRLALDPDELVVGVKIGDTIQAFSHQVLNWHEIVNTDFTIDGQRLEHTLSYCPLTGSAMLWRGELGSAPLSFGTSGLLLNSNLVLYDRQTGSLWSQMLEQAINGPNLLAIPERVQVIETSWQTWLEMYPNTQLMTDFTGYSRPYDSYPYGSFRTDLALRFPVENSDDRRLHPKTRVLGINVGDASKVYPIESFGDGIAVINDRVGEMDVVAVGSTNHNLGAVYNRQLEDCSTLEFSPLSNQLPVVMADNEGNHWDIFGKAVSGPRTGLSLQKTNSYIAYWFAWTAFFPGTGIYE